MQLDPGLCYAHATRGNALHGMYRYAEAKASYEAALAIDPNNAVVKQTLADCDQRLAQRATK